MQSIINSDQLGCGNYPAGPALENFGWKVKVGK